MLTHSSAGYLVGRLISTALDAEGDQNIKQFRYRVARANLRPVRKRKDRCEYVAEKLSGLPETFGKEASYGDRPLPLR